MLTYGVATERRVYLQLNRYFAKRIKKGLENKLTKQALYNQPTETIVRYLKREGRNRYNVMDEDPDPFLLKEIKSDSVLPQYEVDGLPLPRGIRPDQLRYKFTAEDLEACGLHKDDEDFKLIYRALSYYNANGKEVMNQLKANEVARWGYHPFDTGRLEVQITCMTIKMRRLFGQIKNFPRQHTSYFWYRRLFYTRRRMMKRLRKLDFGRYKKVMTYLGMRDTLAPAINHPAIHRYAHIRDKRKPIGGRKNFLGPI